MTGTVPDDVWDDVVTHVPIVSVDLVVEYDGGVVLGKRTNEPARGEWFVPGGVLEKGEALRDGARRVGQAELGCEVTIETRLGVYEHRYDVSELGDVSKHYVPIGYAVSLDEGASVRPDDQHADLRVFRPPFSGFHEYVRAYLEDYLEWKE